MGSRLWPSKVMKIGLRVSSSRRHSPSLRGPDRQAGHGQASQSPTPSQAPDDAPEALATPGPAQKGV